MTRDTVLDRLRKEFRSLALETIKEAYMEARKDYRKAVGLLQKKSAPGFVEAVFLPKITVQSRDFVQKKKQFEAEMDQLHKKRNEAMKEGNVAEGRKWANTIDKRAIEFHGAHEVRSNYFNLHWMTTAGAVWHAKKQVGAARQSGAKELLFETGMGRHSIGGQCRIKQALLYEFAAYKDCTCRFQVLNQGLLVLTFK